MEQQAPDTIDLRDYLVVLQRRWRTIAGLTVVVVVVALAASLTQTPQYASSAELAIEPVRSGSEAALEDLLLRDEIVETERRVITSTRVAQRVIDELGLGQEPSTLLEMIDVRTVPNTRVVEITATDTDPQFAAQVANSFASSYLDYRRDRALEEVTAARTNLDERAQELREEIATIDGELEPSGASGVLPNDDGLEAQREALSQQLAQVTIQLAGLDPSSEAVRGGGEVLVPADADDAPVSPKPLRTGVLALVLGLMLGVGAAFLRDHFDDAVRTEDDVRRATGGRPVVGRVATWDDDRADAKLITLVDPYASASEEFQALAANVRFALLSADGRHDRDDTGRSIIVTSGTQAEGKTSVAANLAVAAASAGRRVILVGADLRRPTMARRFGLPDGVGLTDTLVDAAQGPEGQAVDDHLIDLGIPRLRLLPAGSIPPNPTELVASRQMVWLHDELVRRADLVIFDTPPVLPVADTLELSTLVDLTFVVVRVEQGNRRDLAHAVERLEQVGATIGGVVMNGLTAGRRRYGYGGYRYQQEQDDYRPRAQDDEAAAPAASPPSTESGDDSQVPGPRIVSAKGMSKRSPIRIVDRPSPGDPPAKDAARAPADEADDRDDWLFRDR